MRSRTAVSVLILVILGLHAIPILSYQGNRQTRWPFLLWAMYAKSFPPGPIEAVLRTLIAISPDGKKRTVGNKDVGLTSPGLSSNYVQPFERGDTSAARWLVDRLNRFGPDSVAELRLVTVRHRLVGSRVVVDTLPITVYRPARPAGR